MSTRPNIPWITTHGITPHLGCHNGLRPGAEYAVTPHLDRLAAQGALRQRLLMPGPGHPPRDFPDVDRGQLLGELGEKVAGDGT